MNDNGLAHPSADVMQALIYGRLGESEAEQVAAHLDTCVPCEATFAELESGVLQRRSLPGIPPSDFAPASDADRPIDSAAIERVIAAALQLKPIGQGDETSDHAESAGEGNAESPLPRHEPERLGAYELLEPIGQGGMGVVFRARHTKLDRLVAVKVLPVERLHDSGAVARFEREQRAVGKLEHPNIVRAYDAGVANRRHFMAMELLDGHDLSHVLRLLGPLSSHDACEIVRRGALGLQHAHENKLIHRDVKPSNLWLTSNGEVKLLDLGLARLHDTPHGLDELTSAGQPMGTYDYMAPEQFTDSRSVDLRADLYSLGASLYRLLAGTPPFPVVRRGPVVTELRDAETPLPSLRAVRPDVDVELENVVNQLLAYDPKERPASAAEIALSLAKFSDGADLTKLARRAAKAADQKKHGSVPTRSDDDGSFGGEILASDNDTGTSRSTSGIDDVDDSPAQSSSQSPSQSRPPSNNRRLLRPFTGKTPQRNARGRTALRRGALAAVVAALVAVIAVYGGTMTRFITNQGVLVIESKAPAGTRITVEIDQDGHVIEVFEVESRKRTVLKAGDYKIQLTLGGDQKGLTLTSDRVSLSRGGKELVEVRWEPPANIESNLADRASRRDGSRAAGSTNESNKPPTAAPIALQSNELRRFKGHSYWVRRIALLPGGKQFLSGSFDQTVRLWDVESGEALHQFRGHRGNIESLVVASDGKRAFSGDSEGVIWEWDLKQRAGSVFARHTSVVMGLALLANDKRLAVSISEAPHLMVYDISTRDVALRIAEQDSTARDIAPTPDGRSMLAAGLDGTVRLYDAESGGVRWVSRGHYNWVTIAAVSNSATTAVTGSWDQSAVVWDLKTGNLRSRLTGEINRLEAAAIAPDGRWVLTGGHDGLVRLWDLNGQEPTAIVGRHDEMVFSVAFLPDGERALSSSGDGTIRLWKLPMHAVDNRTIDPSAKVVTGSLDADPLDKLTAENIPASLRFEDLPRETVAAHSFPRAWHQGMVTRISLSADGGLLASGSRAGEVRLWDAMTLLQSQEHAIFSGETPIYSVAFSPDETMLAAGSDDMIRVYRLNRPREGHPNDPIPDHLLHPNRVISVAFSRDGKTLVSVSHDATLRVWPIEDGKFIVPPLTSEPTSMLLSVAVSADGKTIATGSQDGELTLWRRDGEAVQKVASIRGHRGMLNAMSFCDDDQRLVTVGGWPNDNTGHVWTVKEDGLERTATLTGHTSYISSLAVSPNGKQIITGANDRTIRFWNDHGEETSRIDLPPGTPEVTGMAWDFPAERLYTTGDGHDLRIWDLAASPVREITVRDGDELHVWSMAFTRDGSRLYAGLHDGTVRMVDFSTGRPIDAGAIHPTALNIHAVAISPDGRTLATGGAWHDNIEFWSLRDVAPVKTVSLIGHSAGLLDLEYSRDGRWLASACYDNTARLWNLESDSPTSAETFRLHEAWVNSVAFSLNSEWLATAGGDHLVRIWKAGRGPNTSLFALHGHASDATCVAFLGDGKQVVAGGDDGRILVWELPSAASDGGAAPIVPRLLTGHHARVTSIAVSPDGRRFVSTSKDGKAILWPATGRVSERLWTFPGSLSSSLFAADGRHLALGRDNGSVYILRLTVGGD